MGEEDPRFWHDPLGVEEEGVVLHLGVEGEEEDHHLVEEEVEADPHLEAVEEGVVVVDSSVVEVVKVLGPWKCQSNLLLYNCPDFFPEIVILCSMNHTLLEFRSKTIEFRPPPFSAQMSNL